MGKFDTMVLRGRLDRSSDMDTQRLQGEPQPKSKAAANETSDVSRTGLKVSQLSRTGKRIVKLSLNMEVNMADALHDLTFSLREKVPGNYSMTDIIEISAAMLLISQGTDIDDINITPNNRKLLDVLMKDIGK